MQPNCQTDCFFQARTHALFQCALSPTGVVTVETPKNNEGKRESHRYRYVIVLKMQMDLTLLFSTTEKVILDIGRRRTDNGKEELSRHANAPRLVVILSHFPTLGVLSSTSFLN